MRFWLSVYTVRLLGIVVVCALSPAVLLLYASQQTGRTGSPRSTAAASVPQTTSERIAGVLRELAHRPLNGAIYFRYTTRLIRDDPSATQVQEGVLYAGSHGRLRLDLLLKSEHPIICAVTGQTAWMVWGESPLVYTSALPIEGEASGWRGQLQAQVGQMLYWADVLLARMLHTSPPRQVVRLQSAEDTLIVGLTARGRGFFPGPLVVQLMPAGKQWRVTRIEAGDTTLQYDGPMLLYGTHNVPSRITMMRPAASGSTRVNVWQIVDVLPLEDVGGEDVFAVPGPTTRLAARLVGELHFGRDGRQHLTIWK